MRLSTSDLGFFFAPHHVSLADELAAAVAPLSALAEPAAMAASMGADLDLYRFFVGDRVDLRAVCLVREFLGYVSPVADSIFAVQGLGTFPIARAGSEDQRARYLADCRAGRKIAGFALTEPEAGSDVASMQTTARADGDEYVLNGEKTLISNVGIASHYVVFANANRDLGRKGITGFIVESGASGLTETAIELGAPHPIGALSFDDCRVSSNQRLGEVGAGFRLAMTTLDAFRVSVGAAANGMASRALDEACGHVTAREQFGEKLAEKQIVQAYIAEMATELDAARLMVLRAAFRKDTTDERVSVEAAMAKLYATEAAQRVIDKAVQLFGGRGVCSGEVVEHLYRAIRPLRIYEGTSEIQKLIIARGLLR